MVVTFFAALSIDVYVILKFSESSVKWTSK